MGKSLNFSIEGLYAITPDEQDTERLLGLVRLALQGGAKVLQYRNKKASAVLKLEQAMALHELALSYSVPLIVNDDAALAQCVDAEGVHIGSEDGGIARARALLGARKIVGVSCYNRIDLAHEAEGSGADYVAFGAFFRSGIKPNAPVASLDLLRQARREIKLPMVAIGGITEQSGAELLDAGADALAVISALFGAEDVLLCARRLANLKLDRKEKA
jgi:thiamine-phosphate pyrophosphorylase